MMWWRGANSILSDEVHAQADDRIPFSRREGLAEPPTGSSGRSSGPQPVMERQAMGIQDTPWQRAPQRALTSARRPLTLILNIYIRGKIIHKVFYFLKPYSINKVWEELTKPLNYDPRYIHLQLGWSLPRLFSPQTSLSLSDKRTRSTAAQHRMDLRTSRDLKPGIARPILSDSLRPGLSLATSMVAGGNPILPWLGGYRREMICRELGARGYLRNQHAQ